MRVTYEEVPFGTKPTFHRPDSFEDMDAGPGFRQSSGNEPEGLSGSELAVWRHIRANGPFKTSEIAAALGITDRATRKVLGNLVAEGLVEAQGQPRARRYRLRED